jgi:hypothetical protein
MLKKIVLLTLAATAFRCSVIVGTPLDRHIGKYLGLPFAGAAVSSAVPIQAAGDSKNGKKNGAAAEAPAAPLFVWLSDAALELKKVPFFVRGRAKRNIESYATEKGVAQICMATVAEARTHFSKAKK